MEQTLGVPQSEAFWRLSLFTFLLVGVRLVFRHTDATMPKYMVSTFGPSAPFGLVYSINPFLITFLVPIVGLLTRHVDSYTMILVGACISGVSPFWMALGAFYWFMILFMFTLSVGEAIYSPRVYEVSVGFYMAATTCPFSLRASLAVSSRGGGGGAGQGGEGPKVPAHGHPRRTVARGGRRVPVYERARSF
ncbi:hypothetical protein I4F81_006181 [Pyropia yezoensis]|uniref:Uncharacterized protein n=1 Tax=Pyropia yezoensis TaxID=2788 RepID=A0ACC3C0F9_PYRYE|nr:hypothetical protein I4F81_006181 [Neopyropia yezoensis]